MIRLFAALPLPFDITEGLARRTQGLPRAAWRPVEGLHITLAFFGEMDEARASDLDLELGRLVMEPFLLHLEGVGQFVEGPSAQTLHARVPLTEPLERLARKCETAARKVGVRPETRAYRPHVTLASVKRAPPERVVAWIAAHNLLRSPDWRADQFHLYSSLRGERGAHYEVERTYRLA